MTDQRQMTHHQKRLALTLQRQKLTDHLNVIAMGHQIITGLNLTGRQQIGNPLPGLLSSQIGADQHLVEALPLRCQPTGHGSGLGQSQFGQGTR